MSNKPQVSIIFLVSGSVQGGKSTYLSKLVESLGNSSLLIGGFLCPGTIVSGKRTGFKLKNITTGEELVMASMQETSGWIAFGRYWFDPGAFRKGKEWIAACLQDKPDVLFIDEVGPMELEGSGWSESLEVIKNASVPVQIWSVREKLLDHVMEHWNIPGSNVIRVVRMEISEAVEQITRALENK